MLETGAAISDDDLPLVLTALRFMQANLPQLPQEMREILTDRAAVEELEAEGLPDRLDTLCERLNLGYLESD